MIPPLIDANWRTLLVLQYIYIVFDGMVKKPLVSAFQNFLGIENWLNIKKVMGRNMWMCFALTVSTYIAYMAFQISNT